MFRFLVFAVFAIAVLFVVFVLSCSLLLSGYVQSIAWLQDRLRHDVIVSYGTLNSACRV